MIVAGRKQAKRKQAKGAGKTAPKPPADAAAEAAALAAAAAEVAETQARAIDLVAGVVALKGNQRIIPAMIREGRRGGIARAVRAHDTPALYDWFMDLLSLQGISDRNALSYIHKHGNATYAEVGRRLATTRCACPKLESFASFTGCGYRKDARTCANPQHLRLCPVRQLPLRKGLLNIQAVSLHHWLTDVCGGDIVAWIDRTIAAAKVGGEAGATTLPEALPSLLSDVLEPEIAGKATAPSELLSPLPDRTLKGSPEKEEEDGHHGAVQAAEAPSKGGSAADDHTAAPVGVPATGKSRRRLTPPQRLHLQGVEPWAWRAKVTLVASLSAVEGVSAKLANMTFAALMIGGRANDADWMGVASLMVTVDSLIHNMIERTGVLAAFGAEHAYGPRCYGPNGCEAVIYTLTEAIRAREMAASPKNEPPDTCASRLPQLAPIEVQKALWRFCTAGVLNFCNVARVGSGPSCHAVDICPVHQHCQRASPT